MSCTTLTVYSGNLPDSGQSPEQNIIDCKNLRSYIVDTLVTDLNTLIPCLNTLASDTQDAKDVAVQAKVDAVNAKDIAVGATNFQGTWTAGTYNKGESVEYNGYIYLSLEDNNSDEPPTVKWLKLSSDWTYKVITADYTANNKEFLFVDTTNGEITVTLPTNGVVGFEDYKSNFDTNKLVVQTTDSKLIMNTDTFMDVSKNNISFKLKEKNGDWRLV